MGFFRKMFRSAQQEHPSSYDDQPVSLPIDAPEAVQPANALSAEHPPDDGSGSAEPAAEIEWEQPAQTPEAELPAPPEHQETADTHGSTLPPVAQTTTPDPLPDEPVPSSSAADAPEPEHTGQETPGEERDSSSERLHDTEPLAAFAPAEKGTNQLSSHSVPALRQQRSVQGLAAAALRDIGRVRANNQDSVFTLLTTLPRENSDLPMGLFIVADGMGGHEGGEVASRLAIRTVVHEVLSQLVMRALDDDTIEALQPLMISAVEEANRVIWAHSQRVHSDMGTTCTAVLMLGQALYVAHVGDTRAYLFGPDGLQTLTEDHSAVGRLIQLGQINPAEAQDHPLRSQLYRTIGQQPGVQVDFSYHLIADNTHLLLCSDGLWGMVSENDIVQALQRSPWPQDICQELIALANLAGGEDNISAIVVTLPIPERSS